MAHRGGSCPWLIGEPGNKVPPGKLYGKLKPFQQRVAEDIEQGRQDRGQED